MVRIRLEHIDKVFGKKGREFKALDDISFEIEDNSFFGILGASGAGKTTIMRIIAGLETPTRGAIYFNDQVAASDGKDIIPVEDRNVGMVFQNWALYPHMTNYENIAFPLKSKHWSPEDIHRRITELARVLEISETLEKRPGEISGGQQQRVALARALAKNPSLLLLDEPFSNLDANRRDDARSLVRRVQEEYGITAVIVSHDPSDIFSLARKVAVIHSGRLIQIDTPGEIYDRPRNVRVAGSLGEINLLRGSTSLDGERLVIRVADARIPVPVAASDETWDREVTVGIRPEDLATENDVTNLGGSSEMVKFGTFEVDASNYVHGSFVVSMKVGEERLNVLSRLPVSPGSRLTVYVNASKIKLFDAQSGDLIPFRVAETAQA